jgi:hypothetical protein
MTALSGWANFYVIVGSSAGALIGLQFVVLTLISDMPIVANQDQAGHAFATPTIVHFGAVLLVSAILTAPWRAVTTAAAAWGLLGVIGVVYEIVVARRMRIQPIYRPVLEDWIFHALLPLAAYAALAVSAYVAFSHAHEGLFGTGAAALLLLFCGIHNAWDGVTYHVFTAKHRRQEEEKEKESDRPVEP